MSRLPNKREMWAMAEYLQGVHKDHTRMKKCDPYVTRDYKSLLVQWRFAYLTGGEVDMRRLGGRGDGGRDQLVEMVADGDAYPAGTYAVDTKAAVNPTCLMVDKDTMDKLTRPTIFVLGGIDKRDSEDPMDWDARLLGWERDDILRQRGHLGDRGGKGIISWYLDDRGRDIYELLAKIVRKWSGRV